MMRLKDKVILVTSSYTTGQVIAVIGVFGIETPIVGDLPEYLTNT